MKGRSLLAIVAVIVVIIIAAMMWIKGRYNTMVTLDEHVKTAWGQVENQYQRRLDLIPNLVNTVQGYAAHERQTLENVINARANATRTNLNVDDLNETTMRQFQESQAQLSSALSRLMLVVERYPDLKANEQFRELQAQLEGTENRIAVERMRFNETAQQYNTYIRTFPTTLVAGMLGFHQRPYFTSDPGAERAPTVDFGTAPAATTPVVTPGPVVPALPPDETGRVSPSVDFNTGIDIVPAPLEPVAI